LNVVKDFILVMENAKNVVEIVKLVIQRIKQNVYHVFQILSYQLVLAKDVIQLV